MPTSIIVSIAALSLMLLLNFGLGILSLVNNPTNIVYLGISMGLGALILIGMVLGHRLTWQWGRILGIFAAVLLTLVAFAALLSSDAIQQPLWAKRLAGVFLLVQAACLYTIFFALGRRSAKRHFRLRCPECGYFTSTAADFFFNRARCRECGIKW